MHRRGDQRGQATVEFLGVLPLAMLVAVVLWQAIVAGHAVAMAGSAARAAARAAAVGGDPRAAARRVLPGRLRDGLRVARRRDGSVRVVLRVPAVVGSAPVGSVGASARFAPQGPS